MVCYSTYPTEQLKCVTPLAKNNGGCVSLAERRIIFVFLDVILIVNGALGDAPYRLETQLLFICYLDCQAEEVQ
jgi:hypothetical protein